MRTHIAVILGTWALIGVGCRDGQRRPAEVDTATGLDGHGGDSPYVAYVACLADAAHADFDAVVDVAVESDTVATPLREGHDPQAAGLCAGMPGESWGATVRVDRAGLHLTPHRSEAATTHAGRHRRDLGHGCGHRRCG